jgi:hypothetical protein
MNRTKILAFIAVSAMLFACGSQDGSPAKLTNGNEIISPFDTLVAVFDSKIVDINNLDTNIAFTQEMSQVFPGKSATSSNKLYFVGTYDTTPGGLPYFKPGAVGSVVFSNLKNEDGYIRKEAVLYFSTYRIFDSPSNNTEATADDIDSFDLAVKVTDKDGVTFAGALDSFIVANEQGTIYDTEDNFKLELHARDTIDIKARNFRDSLKVQFFGPGGVDATITAKKGNPNAMKYIIGTDHLTGDDTLGKMVTFYIKVYTDRITSSPNPYLLSVSVKRGKL